MKFVLLMSAIALHAQPVWTDVLTTAGPTSPLNGTAWKIGPTTQPAQAINTTLSAIGNTLSLPVTTLTGAGNQTGATSCGAVGSPVSFIESNAGTGIKGVGFLGSFNSPVGGAPLTYTAGNNLFESVFFHEDPCYGSTPGSTSREYGFFLAASNSSIWVYWGTHENQASQVQGQLQLVGVLPNAYYYFAMYPSGNSTSCGFNVYVLDLYFNAVYPATYIPVNSYNFGGTITTADPGFCTAVTAPMNGYTSANIIAGSQVSGTVPSSLNLTMLRVYVGK